MRPWRSLVHFSLFYGPDWNSMRNQILKIFILFNYFLSQPLNIKTGFSIFPNDEILFVIEKIFDRLVINLEVAESNLRKIWFIDAIPKGFQTLLYNSLLGIIPCHCICFSWPCLAICKNAAIISFEDIRDDFKPYFLEYLLLRSIRRQYVIVGKRIPISDLNRLRIPIIQWGNQWLLGGFDSYSYLYILFHGSSVNVC